MSPERFNQLSEKGSGGVKTGLYILYIQFLLPPCPWHHRANSKATVSFSRHSIRSGLRHSEERHGHRRHVRDAARAHHEVHHPRGHGWHHRHLRAGGGCADSKQHLRKSAPLQVSLV